VFTVESGQRGEAWGQLQAAANGSGSRPKFGRCLRRLPWHSLTGGGCHGSARCCSVAARHSTTTASRVLGREREREPCELLKLEQHEGKALLTWGRRRPRRPVAVALSALRGMEDAVIRMRCHMHARPVTGCERFKRLLRLTSGPGFIS
jgi:hypothetical protein